MNHTLGAEGRVCTMSLANFLLELLISILGSILGALILQWLMR